MAELAMRPYQNEMDFWNIRSFLREVFLLNDRHEYSWPAARWDYWRWHGILNMGDGTLENDVFIWENESGQIVAVLNRENAGTAFLHSHPHFKSSDLEAGMILKAEENLSIPGLESDKVLQVACDSQDGLRQEILSMRGYVLLRDVEEHHWWRNLDQPIPENPIFPGYSLRSLGDAAELPGRSWASWRGFHSGEVDQNYDNDWSWYLNIQSAPLYRRDLDLVAIAPGGEIAAFTTIWYDDVTRCGYFEPVATVPEHRRKGLASTLLSEGMRRLKRMGAIRAMVGGEEDHANALYQSVFGPQYDLTQFWKRTWPVSANR